MASFSRLQTVLLVTVVEERGNRRLSWRTRGVQVPHFNLASTGVVCVKTNPYLPVFLQGKRTAVPQGAVAQRVRAEGMKPMGALIRADRRAPASLPQGIR